MNSENPASPRPVQRRFAKLAAVVGVIVLTASACSSEPSALRIAQDIVNTAADEGSITTEVRDCMLEKLDGYGVDALKDLATAEDGATQNVGELTGLQQYEADLAACNV